MNLNPNPAANSNRNFKLIMAARSGDLKAVTQLKEQYWDVIFYIILKMVNNRDDAESLTAEAFEKAFSNLMQYNTEFPFSRWLYRIASNSAIAHLQKRIASYPYPECQ